MLMTGNLGPAVSLPVGSVIAEEKFCWPYLDETLGKALSPGFPNVRTVPEDVGQRSIATSCNDAGGRSPGGE